eukprot:2333502-Pyramimonas_sp.AAC.1
MNTIIPPPLECPEDLPLRPRADCSTNKNPEADLSHGSFQSDCPRCFRKWCSRSSVGLTFG